MSRSNPTDNSPNPCKRWFEWDGGNGLVRYYDKEKKENIEVGSDLVFIVLDELCTIKGWHDASDSGIFANEIRDTRAETFVVKSFKEGELASGFYKDIRDRVGNMGGNFVANLYIAFKENGEMHLGSLQIKGAALNAWVEFKKKNRADILKKAVQIKGSTEGKKGKIVFHTPNFFIKNITDETDAQAIALDKELQVYLEGYFKRTVTKQAVPAHQAAEDENQEPNYPSEPPPGIDPESGETVGEDGTVNGDIPF